MDTPINNQKLNVIVISVITHEIQKLNSETDTINTTKTRQAETIVGMPKSCNDLSRLGHTKSGLHLIAGNKTIETVYCDFTKQSTESSKYNI